MGKRSKGLLTKTSKKKLDHSHFGPKHKKQKLGKKLAPANATDTSIRSRGLAMTEQSVVTDKSGEAVTNRGLTLHDLLRQLSHYSGSVRKDALLGPFGAPLRILILPSPAATPPLFGGCCFRPA